MGRGDVSFDGIGARYTTYKAHVSLTADNEGAAVALVADSTAGLGSEGDALLGYLLKYEDDGYVTVQDGGYAEFDGVSGSLPSAGDAVVVDGSGKVITMTSAHAAYGKSVNKVVHVDSTNYKVVVLI